MISGTCPNGINYHIGRNSNENDTLVRQHMNDKCTWFHLSDNSSPHGILETDNPSKNSIKHVANIIKEYSKLKNYRKVKVDYLEIKYVKPTKTKGEVFLQKSPRTVNI